MSDWRPAHGYENVEVTPLPTHPTTNQLVQPCFVPNMSTEPINFPNLVTGFEVSFEIFFKDIGIIKKLIF